jgi:hypothetical protein
VTLEEAWAEFLQTPDTGGAHVGTLEAMEMIREAAGEEKDLRRPEPLTVAEDLQGHFFDWLLHVKREKGLAYEFLLKTGTLNVGPRQYWTTRQGAKRAIAWESRYTYPGSDSEIWDVILVD